MPVMQCIASLLCAAIPVVGCAQTQFPADAQPACTVPAATFSSWFATNTPTANGIVLPANSISFTPSSRCSFYQWSEQMFLWLTSPVGSSLVLNSPTFFNVSPSGSGYAYVPNPLSGGAQGVFQVRSAKLGANRLQILKDAKGRLFEILPAPTGPHGKSTVINSAGKAEEVEKVEVGNHNKLVFTGAGGKKITPPKQFKFNTGVAARVAPHLAKLSAADSKKFVQGFLGGPNGQVIFANADGEVVPTQGQAGGAAVLLNLSQVDSKTQSPVYYAMMVNDVFTYFQSNPLSATGKLQFPTSQLEAAAINLFAQKVYQATINDLSALTMEVKTSWVDSTTVTNPAQYITTSGTVPTYDQSNATMWVPNGNKQVTLALVGVHVVGSTAGHPEMIWATFEHVNNSPNYAYSYNSTTSSTPVQVGQSTSGTWIFSGTNSSTASYNAELATLTAPTPSPTPTPTPTPVPGAIYGYAPAGGAALQIGASNTMRTATWGSSQLPIPQGGSTAATNPTVATLNTEVISINNSVRGQLVAPDVRANYMLVGAIWGLGGSSLPTANNQVGTLALANSSMETYHQIPNSTPTPPAVAVSNCFFCHAVTGGAPTINTSVSHIFSGLAPLPKPAPAPTPTPTPAPAAVKK